MVMPSHDILRGRENYIHLRFDLLYVGDILHSSYQSGQDIKEVLEGLLRVKRIDMLIMFLERKQREGKKDFSQYLTCKIDQC